MGEHLALATAAIVAEIAFAHASRENLERMVMVRIGDAAELTATEECAHLKHSTMAPQTNANHARDQ